MDFAFCGLPELNEGSIMLGWSDFAKQRHAPGAGYTYTTLSETEVVGLTLGAWGKRRPGQGETTLDRKVVVPVTFPPGSFFLPVVGLVEGLPVQARVTRRQEGEDLYVETFVYEDDVARLGLKPQEPKYVNVVCYHHEALLENNGTRSTACEWEIVCLLGSMVPVEPMTPLTMARNYLSLPGGTKSVYTAEEFAEAIYFHSTKGGVRIKRRQT